jgi:hypothetical protein
MQTVRGCRWVDEIVADVPYIMNEEYLREIIIKHRSGRGNCNLLSTAPSSKSLTCALNLVHAELTSLSTVTIRVSSMARTFTRRHRN